MTASNLEDEIAAEIEATKTLISWFETQIKPRHIECDQAVTFLRRIKARLEQDAAHPASSPVEGMAAPDDADDTLWRHKRRGTIYVIRGLVRVQAPADAPLQDNELSLLYQDIHTGAYSVRRPPEFHDGRFERVDPPAKGSEGMAAPGDTTERAREIVALTIMAPGSTLPRGAVGDIDELINDIAASLTAAEDGARRAALEEACAAECYGCAHGWERGFDPQFEADGLPPMLMHKAAGCDVWGHPCDAAKIRALAEATPGEGGTE